MAIVNPPLPPEFHNKVVLTCEAKVGRETVFTRTEVVEAVYQDPQAREAIRDMLREQLIREILAKWTPVIKVHRE